jgi:hypothetical protein
MANQSWGTNDNAGAAVLEFDVVGHFPKEISSQRDLFAATKSCENGPPIEEIT